MPLRISMINCLPLLWHFLLIPAADAQQNTEKPHSYPNEIGSEVPNLRAQADRGHAMSEYRLGLLYMTGKGVTSDYKEAARYLHLAAEQGLTEAELVLGYLYENGKGVPAAAKKGNLTAANNLAIMYEYGRGVHKDIRQGVDWHRRATHADSGSLNARLWQSWCGCFPLRCALGFGELVLLLILSEDIRT